MNLDKHHAFLYQRVKEIQPHLTLLVQNFKEMGMTPDEINTEICFAIMNEGYRLKDIEQGVSLKPNERKFQTHIDTHEDNLQDTSGKNSIN